MNNDNENKYENTLILTGLALLFILIGAAVISSLV
jgi:hypothetical protein